MALRQSEVDNDNNRNESNNNNDKYFSIEQLNL